MGVREWQLGNPKRFSTTGKCRHNEISAPIIGIVLLLTSCRITGTTTAASGEEPPRHAESVQVATMATAPHRREPETCFLAFSAAWVAFMSELPRPCHITSTTSGN